MRGTVRKHGKGWQYLFSVTRAGKRRWVSKSGFATEADGWAALRDAMALWEHHPHADPSRDTFGTFLRDEWLPVQSTKKPTTVAGYRYWVERRIIPDLGDIKLRDLTAGDIARWYARLRTNGGRLDGKPGGLSEKSIKQAHAVLHRSLKYAVKAGRLARSPMFDLDVDVKPKPRRPSMTTWTADEVNVFLATVVDEHPFGALFQLALTTGMSRSELLAVRWSDIDLDRMLVSVQRGLTVAANETHFGEPKAERRARSIDVDDNTIVGLRRHRARQLEDRMEHAQFWQPKDLVFSDRMGVELQPTGVSQLFDRRVKRSGVKRICFQEMRHTHATLLLEAGVHPKIVQERLGHASIAITLDVYTHVIPSMQRDAATRIGEILRGG